MFIDEAKITIFSGKGGNGCVSMHREKFMPKGGPDGGDGGDGGSVFFVADHNLQTLMDFRYKRKHAAGNGKAGMGNNCSGSKGEHLIIRVPQGTIIKDYDTGQVLLDIKEGKHIIAKGGVGGKGNARFSSSRNQAPSFATDGKPGIELNLQLELKLIADVGLVGLPNAGKSTLLSRVTTAHPKIANYPFTTKKPNLGIVKVNIFNNFVLADIPGIIEGAHEGKGLGLQFLRHIERTRLLVYVLDCSTDPLEDFNTIHAELMNYSKILANRDHIILLNKIDLFPNDLRDELLSYFPNDNVIFSSSATGEGLDEFVKKTSDILILAKNEEDGDEYYRIREEIESGDDNV